MGAEAGQLLSMTQAAAYSGLSRYEIRKLIDNGTLTPIALPGLLPKVRRTDLDGLIRRPPATGTTTTPPNHGGCHRIVIQR